MSGKLHRGRPNAFDADNMSNQRRRARNTGARYPAWTTELMQRFADTGKLPPPQELPRIGMAIKARQWFYEARMVMLMNSWSPAWPSKAITVRVQCNTCGKFLSGKTCGCEGTATIIWEINPMNVGEKAPLSEADERAIHKVMTKPSHLLRQGNTEEQDRLYLDWMKKTEEAKQLQEDIKGPEPVVPELDVIKDVHAPLPSCEVDGHDPDPSGARCLKCNKPLE